MGVPRACSAFTMRHHLWVFYGLSGNWSRRIVEQVHTPIFGNLVYPDFLFVSFLSSGGIHCSEFLISSAGALFSVRYWIRRHTALDLKLLVGPLADAGCGHCDRRRSVCFGLEYVPANSAGLVDRVRQDNTANSAA